EPDGGAAAELVAAGSAPPANAALTGAGAAWAGSFPERLSARKAAASPPKASLDESTIGSSSGLPFEFSLAESPLSAAATALPALLAPASSFASLPSAASLRAATPLPAAPSI